MTVLNVETIRNVAFCGHGSTGKTTLVDRLLNETGAVTRPASVDDGSSICDFDPEEKHHKYTIEAKLVHFQHGGKHFNVMDTPGYPDFIGQTISCLGAADTAVIVVNAHAGVQVNTRRTFNEAGNLHLGRMILLNKLDDHNIDLPKLVHDIQELFGHHCIPLNVPVGVGDDFKAVVSTLHPPADTSGAVLDVAAINTQLIESIVEIDEEVMSRYFEGAQPTGEELRRLMETAIAAGALVPIICCSAKTGVGVTELLDILAAEALEPCDIKRTAKDHDGNVIEIKCDPEGPLVAREFKTRIDPFVQKLSYLRIFSGKLHKDQGVHVAGTRKPVKLTQLLRVQANETHPIDEAGPGDIVAVAKMEDLHTGSVLGDYELEPLPFPTPMVGLAVMPKSRGDEAKLSTALHKVEEEDPTLHLDRDAQTKELVMTGMSELHLTIVQERLKRRDKVEVDTKEPKIPYRETIQADAEGSYRHKKQSGGRGQFGEVHIRMYPLPRGTDIDEWANKTRFPSLKEKHYDEENNFLWVDTVVGGTIPGNFLPAIEKGFKERLARGVIAGHQVQNVCVEVHFGKHHPVDSSEAAFKTAGSMAFRNVFQQAKPTLLEPIVKLSVTVPGGNVGDVYSDMSGRRGRVLGTDASGGDWQTVHAEVPLAEVTTYARTLSSMTGGQGSYTIEFSHYDVVPGNILKDILDKSKMVEEEEESD